MLATAQADPEAYLVHRLLYMGGLRGGDVRHINPAGDLIPEQRTLFLRGGKGDKDRYVLLDAKTARLLRQFAQPLDFSDTHLLQLVNDVAVECGLYDQYAALGQRVSPHTLRHAFATHRYEAGMSFPLISHLLGHALAEDTVTYTRSASAHMRAAYDRFNPFAPTLREKPNLQAEPAPSSPYQSEQERKKEFAQQPGAARLNGLPAVPSPEEVSQLLRKGVTHPGCQLLFRTLYASGGWFSQVFPLQASHVDPDQPRLRLPQGLLRLDPKTWKMLKDWKLANDESFWGISKKEALSFFEQTCRVTGLEKRYQCMGRRLHIDVLRYSFATHSVARNIDAISLMTLLGHQCYETTEAYLHSATYRFLDQYDATTNPEVEP